MASVRYIFERHSRAATVETYSFALPLNPTSINFRRNEATVLTWTLDGEPVIEHGGIRERTIEIRGRSGVQTRIGTDHFGRPLHAPSTDLFQEFEFFLELYQMHAARLGGKDRETANIQPTWMEFHALWEGLSVKVEPRVFTWTRSAASARHSYEWSMTLVAYASTARESRNIFDAADDVLERAERYMDSITRYVEAAREFASKTDQTLQRVRGVVQSIGDAAVSAMRFAARARSIFTLPQQVIADLQGIAAAGTYALTDLWDATTDATPEPVRDTLSGIIGDLGDMRRETTEGLVEVAGEAKDTLRNAAVAVKRSWKQSTVALTHTLRHGETLEDVAREYLGDTARWPEIARANGMASAHLDPAGAPFRAGAKIVVPNAPLASLGRATRRLPGQDPLGVDLALTADGDLALAGDPGGDLALVRGRRNLEQALRVRFLTSRGESGPFPDFGLPVSVGQAGRASVAGRLSSAVRDQALADPRVSDVLDLAVVDAGDTYTVDCTLEPILGSEVQILIPVPA